MSTTTKSRSREEALREAEAFKRMFPAHCYERWEFAGSLRRRQPTVNDIEHVIIPNIVTEEKGIGLFTEPVRVNKFIEHLDGLASLGTISKHNYGSDEEPRFKWGPRSRSLDFKEFTHDIYLTEPCSWGSTLAIRTGPGSFSKMLVTRIQKYGHMNNNGYVWDKSFMSCKCGWSGKDVDATWLPNTGAKGMIRDPGGRDGPTMIAVCPSCRRSEDLAPRKIACPTEQHYFELCHVAYMEPWDRKEITTQRY